MTPEEQAVIEAVKAWRMGITTAGLHIRIAVDALLASEQPPAPVWPDPPTEYVVWQCVDRRISNYMEGIPESEWRKLRVTYTPADEPSPLERIAEMEAALADPMPCPHDEGCPHDVTTEERTGYGTVVLGGINGDVSSSNPVKWVLPRERCHERWGVYYVEDDDFEVYKVEHTARCNAQEPGRRLVRIVATEVPV